MPKAKKTSEPGPKKYLEGKNFECGYGCDVDYDRVYDCENNHCDYICRCAVIENAHLKSVPDLTRHFKDLDLFDQYCIDRMLRSKYRVYDPDSWEVETCGGYYGEEIKGVYLYSGKQADEDIRSILTLASKRSKIEYVLTLEYGYLLDAVKGLDWQICEVDRNEITMGARDHYKKLNKDVVASYADYPLPRGILINKPGDKGFRLIDGYHRVSAAPKNTFNMILGQ